MCAPGCSLRHEAPLQAYVHGIRRWVRTPLHIIDLVIVCVSLALEITAAVIHDAAVDLGGLLVVFRLWRVVRVMHAVGEVEHHAHKEKDSGLEMTNARLQSINEAHHRIIKELHREYTQRVLPLLWLAPPLTPAYVVTFSRSSRPCRRHA